MVAQPDVEGFLIPIDLSGSAEMPALHVNQVLIQHTEHEFLVTFYEMLPPPITPDPTRQAEELAKIKAVAARPVAKLVMSPGRARELAAALFENIAAYDSRKREQDGGRLP